MNKDIFEMINIAYTLVSPFIGAYISAYIESSKPFIKRTLINTDEIQNEQKKSIGKEISSIPDEDKIIPRASIIFPSVEALMIYSEEEYVEIRKFFFKLIAAACNKRKQQALHPGFIEIIKQLSPMDARVLFSIHDSGNITGISAVKNEIEYRLIDTNIISSAEDVTQIALVIDNLTRLGLIHVNQYTTIDFLESENGFTNISVADPLEENDRLYKILANEYKLYKVKAYLTVLGENFMKVCVD